MPQEVDNKSTKEDENLAEVLVEGLSSAQQLLTTPQEDDSKEAIVGDSRRGLTLGRQNNPATGTCTTNAQVEEEHRADAKDGEELTGDASITPEARLSVYANGYEWSCYAFPPTTFFKISGLSHSHLDNTLQYAVAQVSTYLTIGADRRRLGGVFMRKIDLLVGEEMSFEEQMVAVNGRVNSLSQSGEELEGENKGLVKRLSYQERVLVERDRKLVLKEGVVKIVNRVIEDEEFIQGTSVIKDVCGIDYASIFLLGELDMKGM
ncbi:hypothetical protein LXL04_007624 [Taraxacum kok-saghyz]